MATLLYPGTEFRVTNLEMIKGIRVGETGKNLCYHDELVVPIIENTPEEKDLEVRIGWPQCGVYPKKTLPYM